MTGDSRQRKDDHLDLCLNGSVGFREKTTLLEQVELVHDSLPEVALGDVDLSVKLLGRRLAAPMVVAAMTGGTERAEAINRDLAAAAEHTGIAFGLGSQRRQLREGSLLGFQVRDVAPTCLLLGNIGIAQASESSTAELLQMVRASGLDALCLHLNPAMEVIQPGGDRDFRGGLDTVRRLVEELPVPLVVKETGSGISRGVAERLVEVGVRAVDVSGAGGTSWVGVETLRARGREAEVGSTFWEWGIPTAASLAQISASGLTAVATGGLHGGLDALRALALGASAAGFARHFLKIWASEGRSGLIRRIEVIQAEIRVGMFLAGCRDLEELHRAPLVLGPDLLRWVPRSSPILTRLAGAPADTAGVRLPARRS